MTWWTSIAPKSRSFVDVDRLSFDIENPRFTPEKRPDRMTEFEIIKVLASSADLEELVQSIAASGYIDIEPLIVVGKGEELVVIEGNRRLAALRVLRNRELAREAKITLPDVTPAVRETLDSVSVYRVESEDDARTLIGFKHINGPQAWDAYAKGLYAAKWLDDEREKSELGMKGLNLSDIAMRMGDKNDTVYRIVTAVYVLEQAEETGMFSVPDRATKNFSFSHLYTALTYQEYRDFIGMAAAERKANPIKSPVPEDRLPNLKRLMIWLYGSRSEVIEPQIKKQNPDIARLKRVLGDARSTRVMLERNNLDEAVESTIAESDKFERYIVDAEALLKNAMGSLDGYVGDDAALLDIGESVYVKARTIIRAMRTASTHHAEESDV